MLILSKIGCTRQHIYLPTYCTIRKTKKQCSSFRIERREKKAGLYNLQEEKDRGEEWENTGYRSDTTPALRFSRFFLFYLTRIYYTHTNTHTHTKIYVYIYPNGDDASIRILDYTGCLNIIRDIIDNIIRNNDNSSDIIILTKRRYTDISTIHSYFITNNFTKNYQRLKVLKNNLLRIFNTIIK